MPRTISASRLTSPIRQMVDVAETELSRTLGYPVDRDDAETTLAQLEILGRSRSIFDLGRWFAYSYVLRRLAELGREGREV